MQTHRSGSVGALCAEREREGGGGEGGGGGGSLSNKIIGIISGFRFVFRIFGKVHTDYPKIFSQQSSNTFRYHLT